jgi:hypothetical protein
LVYSFLAPVLAEALAAPEGTVLDVASRSGALGRLLAMAVAVDLVHEQLLHTPSPAAFGPTPSGSQSPRIHSPPRPAVDAEMP